MKKNFKFLLLFFGVIFLSISILSVSASPVQVKFLFRNSGFTQQMLTEVCTEFAKDNPNIQIVPEFSNSDMNQRITTLLAAKDVPDIAFTYETGAKFIELGVFESLDSLFKNGMLKKSDYNPTILDSVTMSGHIYGFPVDGSCWLLFYNKELFDKANLPYPNGKWTIKDLTEVAQKLTLDSNGKNATQNGFDPKKIQQYGFNTESWYPELVPNLFGGGLFPLSAKKPMFDAKSPKTQKGLQWMTDAMNKYYFMPNWVKDANAPGFTDGKIAMMATGQWNISYYHANAKFPFDVNVIPTENGGATPFWASTFQVFKDAPHKKEALKFIEWCFSKKGQTIWAKFGGGWPIHKEVVAAGTFIPDWVNKEAVLTAIKTAKTAPAKTRWTGFEDFQNTVLNSSLNKLWNGETTVKQFVEETQKKGDMAASKAKLLQ